MTSKAHIASLQGTSATRWDANRGCDSLRRSVTVATAETAIAIDRDSDVTVPLVVDLDSALMRSDHLFETAFLHLGSKPQALFAMLRALTHGTSALLSFLRDAGCFRPGALAYDTKVLSLLHLAHDAGRPIYLASSANESDVGAIANHLGIFDGFFAATSSGNQSVSTMAQRLADAFGVKNFDYLGGDATSLPVWTLARKPIAIGPSRSLANSLRDLAPDAQILGSERASLNRWGRQLRVHQYAKNALVFLPMFAAHMFDLASLVTATIAALAFCLAASACYILNDLVDLAADRAHRTKKDRPLAKGDIPLRDALLAIPVLLSLAALVSLSVSVAFAGVLAGYFALTTLYTLHLKRILLVDVLTLSGLYTIRLLGGAVALGISLSPWLVVFSLSIFVSLALMKRFVELAARIDAKLPSPENRDYENVDLGMLAALSAAAGFNAVTVLALYVSGYGVSSLYTRPDLLILACPILTYWIGRALILAQRRQMQDDPVVFAIKDPMSRLSGLAMLAVFVAASC